MFFPAFSGEVYSRLPKETIFTLEYLTSQILVNAVPNFFEETIAHSNFIEALLQELEFFGQLRKDDFPAIKEYLMNYEPLLKDFIAKILTKRSDPDTRRYWLSPLPS